MGSTLARRLLVVVLAVSLLAVPAGAQEVRGGGTVTVPAGTVHEGDLTVFGGSVIVDGTVDGSIEGLAGSITVTGTVTGDIEAAAGSVTINGDVEGDLRTATGSVTVTEGARVGGSLETGSGTLTLDGAVDGDVRAGVATLTVSETARIGGDLTYDADTVSIADAAEVGGTTQQVDSIAVDVGLPVVGINPFFSAGLFAIFGFLVNFVLGALLLVAAPGVAGRVADTGAEEPLIAGIVGLAVFVGVPIALIAIAFTIVGIPLTIAGFLTFALVLWVAFVYGAIVVGSWLLSLADYDSLWGGLAVGLILAAVVSLVPFGDVLSFLYLIIGLGAFARTLLAMRRGGGTGPATTEGERPGGTEAI